jgi:hypothetical protein
MPFAKQFAKTNTIGYSCSGSCITAALASQMSWQAAVVFYSRLGRCHARYQAAKVTTGLHGSTRGVALILTGPQTDLSCQQDLASTPESLAARLLEATLMDGIVLGNPVEYVGSSYNLERLDGNRPFDNEHCSVLINVHKATSRPARIYLCQWLQSMIVNR